MKISTSALEGHSVNTPLPEQPPVVPLDSFYETIAQSPCMPHLDLSYIQMLDIANTKPAHLLFQEQRAAARLLAALNNDNGVSDRISKLSNEQIRILFPSLYIEAAHRLNPIVAYHIKDSGHGDKEHDDNVTMLNGYADFSTAVTEATKGKEQDKSLEARAELLLDRYIHLAGSLSNTATSNVFNGASANYAVPAKKVFKHEEIYQHLNGKPFANPLSTLSCGHKLGIIPIDDKIMYCAPFSDPIKKEQVTREILTRYISALDAGNVNDILQTTVDYQFLHLLPNANGRCSQIMRDCALMHLGHLPLSSLTTNSHYLSPQQPVEHEHFLFMQKNSEEILTAIEQQNLTLSLCKKNTPHLVYGLVADAKTEAIKFDIEQFLGEEAAKYFAPSLHESRPHSFA